MYRTGSSRGKCLAEPRSDFLRKGHLKIDPRDFDDDYVDDLARVILHMDMSSVQTEGDFRVDRYRANLVGNLCKSMAKDSIGIVLLLKGPS